MESINIGEQIIKAYGDLQNEMKKKPSMNEIFEPIGADRNLIAALTEAIILELRKNHGLGSYGVLQEGLEWGFKAVDEMDMEERSASYKCSFKTNLLMAIAKRMKRL